MSTWLRLEPNNATTKLRRPPYHLTIPTKSNADDIATVRINIKAHERVIYSKRA